MQLNDETNPNTSLRYIAVSNRNFIPWMNNQRKAAIVITYSILTITDIPTIQFMFEIQYCIFDMTDLSLAWFIIITNTALRNENISLILMKKQTINITSTTFFGSIIMRAPIITFTSLTKILDYTIKCTDGSMLAVGMVLNLSSKYMKKHFKESEGNEFICEHKIDVVKPIILYLHSLDFQMPESYNIDYVDRLLKAIDFFELERSKDIKERIESSLLLKFVEENANFDSLLKLVQISLKHSFILILRMSCAIIANKYYFKWIDTFPENARNPGNPLFCDIFGPEGHIDLENDDSLTRKTFEAIKKHLMVHFSPMLFYNIFSCCDN